MSSKDRLACACSNTPPGDPCPAQITQEDLLCDFCAGRRGGAVGAVSCAEIVQILGRPTLHGSDPLRVKASTSGS